jgi:hypothetical protein
VADLGVGLQTSGPPGPTLVQRLSLGSQPRWLRHRFCGPSLFHAAPPSRTAAQPARLHLRLPFYLLVSQHQIWRGVPLVCADAIPSASGFRLRTARGTPGESTPPSGMDQVSAGAARCSVHRRPALGTALAARILSLGGHLNDRRWPIVSLEWVVMIAPEQDWEL